MRFILNVDNVGLLQHAARAAKEFYDHHPDLKVMGMTHADGAASFIQRRSTKTIVVITQEPTPNPSPSPTE